MDNKRSFKKLKWFVSYAEELYWLEEMALMRANIMADQGLYGRR